MSPANTPLDALRREIDAVDDAMHDLLIKRAALSDGVRAAKGDAGPVVFRPGREAAILRRLVARHSGPLPADVVVRVWREIISASVRLQAPFNVAVYATPGDAHALDLAQAHFGMLTPLLPLGSIGTVLSAISDGRAQVGLLPLPEDAPEPWWRGFGLGGAGALFVLARLPFVVAGAGPSALVVGRQPFESTDADRGYLVVETDREISRARLAAALSAVGLKPVGFPAEADEPGGREGGGASVLVETETNVAGDDPRLVQVREKAEEIARVRAIGGYAVPLTLPPVKRA